MEMFNRADIVALLIIFYFTCFGWVQGVMRFLIAFIAFFIGGQFALSHFQATQNIVESLKIFLLSSTGILVACWFVLSFWNRAIVKSKKCTPLSRMLGALIGFGWALSLTSVIMVFLVLVRIDQPFFKKARIACSESFLYTLVEQRFLSNYPFYKALKGFYENPDLALPSSPTVPEQKNIFSAEDLEAVSRDEKLQAILADEQIKKMIEEKDFGRLLSDPKIQALLQDKAFVQKLIKLYGGMAKNQ